MYGNPSNKGTIGTLLRVPNRGVSLIQALFCTCSYVAGTANGVLYTEVSFIQGCPLIQGLFCTCSYVL